MERKISITCDKKVIAKQAKLCDTIPSRILGLMFSRPKAAVLKAEKESIAATSIHTFFMRFPIDVIWLNRNLEIVDFKKNIGPYRFLIVPRQKAMYVVEMPSEPSIKLQIGKKMKFSI